MLIQTVGENSKTVASLASALCSLCELRQKKKFKLQKMKYAYIFFTDLETITKIVFMH